VILETAGTVTQVAESGAGLGSSVEFSDGNAVTAGVVSTTYDPDEQKIVTVYSDAGNSSYGTAVIGTMTSDNVLSYGTPVVFESASSNCLSACYDTTNNKVVIVYQDNGNSSYGTGIVGTVSGTSISFGTATAYTTHNSAANVCIFEPNSGKIVIATTARGGINKGYTYVGTVSGTGISFGSYDEFSATVNEYTSMSYDPDNSNQILIVYRDDGSSGHGTVRLAAVSGTSLTFGTAVVFSAATTYHTQTVYDTVQNKHVVFYSDNGGTEYYSGKAIVATTSGTDVSFGSAVTYKQGTVRSGGYTQGSYALGACWDSINNQIPMAYCFNDWADNSRDFSYVLYATLDSGGTLTFSDEIQFDSAVWTNLSGQTCGNFAAFDTNQGSMAYAWQESSGDTKGYALAYQPVISNMTASNFLGIADEAISASASGVIVVQGGTSAKLTSLTIGSNYYVQDDGTITTVSSTVSAGLAISATALLLSGDS
jgi:hypothetical protein